MRETLLVRLAYGLLKATLVLLAVGFLTGAQTATADEGSADDRIEVRSFKDTASAGWAFKEDDTAFVAQKGGIKIQWNVVSYKDRKKKSLEGRKAPVVPFSQQAEMHRAILRAIFNHWPPEAFDQINWGGFGDPSDWSWCVPIAAASARSAAYDDYKQNYPHSRLTSLNALFVQLAEETRAFEPLEALFAPFGAHLTLSGVEKVFTRKAEELAFYAELKEQGIAGATRVIYDVGMSWFKLETKPVR